MTHKLFWHDPYLTELETRITSVEGCDITVDRTIFYALSGGQESDQGTIGARPVLAARKAGKQIIYTLGADHGLQPGQTVLMSIDWSRRYALMRLHFAAEIVLELISRHLVGVEKIGAHIAQDKARIDFSWPETVAPLLPTVQQQANAIVAADHAIVSDWSDEANERRYWEIAGFARVSCGGTHLKRTGEVGQIALKRKNVGKHKERVEISVTLIAL